MNKSICHCVSTPLRFLPVNHWPRKGNFYAQMVMIRARLRWPDIWPSLVWPNNFTSPGCDPRSVRVYDKQAKGHVEWLRLTVGVVPPADSPCSDQPTLWQLHPTSSSCQVFLFVFHRPARAAAIYLPWSLVFHLGVLVWYRWILVQLLIPRCWSSSYSHSHASMRLQHTCYLHPSPTRVFSLTLSPRRGLVRWIWMLSAGQDHKFRAGGGLWCINYVANCCWISMTRPIRETHYIYGVCLSLGRKNVYS